MGENTPIAPAAMDRDVGLEEIYAGIEGQGANDAAYATAIEIENCRLQGIDYSGGAADIFKCFDQVRREIVYKLMEETGIPKGILTAYRDFQESYSRGARRGVCKTHVNSTGRPTLNYDNLVTPQSMGDADEEELGQAEDTCG